MSWYCRAKTTEIVRKWAISDASFFKTAQSPEYFLQIGIDPSIINSLLSYLSSFDKKQRKLLIRALKRSVPVINDHAAEVRESPKIILKLMNFTFDAKVRKVMEEAGVDVATAENAIELSPSYALWIARQIKFGGIVIPEDINVTREILTRFDQLKAMGILSGEEADIYSYETKGKLLNKVNEYSTAESKSQQEQRVIAGGTSLVAEEDGVRLTEISSARAAGRIAQGTGWCVKEHNYATNYLKDGPLYLFEVDGEKVALVHRESFQIKGVDGDTLKDWKVISRIQSLMKQYFSDFLESGKGNAHDFNEITDAADEMNENISGPESKMWVEQYSRDIFNNPELIYVFSEENRPLLMDAAVEGFTHEISRVPAKIRHVSQEMLERIGSETILAQCLSGDRGLIGQLNRQVRNLKNRGNYHEFITLQGALGHIPTSLRELFKKAVLPYPYAGTLERPASGEEILAEAVSASLDFLRRRPGYLGLADPLVYNSIPRDEMRYFEDFFIEDFDKNVNSSDNKDVNPSDNKLDAIPVPMMRPGHRVRNAISEIWRDYILYDADGSHAKRFILTPDVIVETLDEETLTAMKNKVKQSLIARLNAYPFRSENVNNNRPIWQSNKRTTPVDIMREYGLLIAPSSDDADGQEDWILQMDEEIGQAFVQTMVRAIQDGEEYSVKKMGDVIQEAEDEREKREENYGEYEYDDSEFLQNVSYLRREIVDVTREMGGHRFRRSSGKRLGYKGPLFRHQATPGYSAVVVFSNPGRQGTAPK